tara:strand:+ start:219 stop:821 length:603 start_codon:yes stop_codon:yes gene_type:complete
MENLELFFINQMQEHSMIVERCRQSLLEPFISTVKICTDCVSSGNKILFFGNGGSASDAQHLSTELTVRFSKNRKAIAAVSLSTDTSTLTAIGNDLGFEFIFSRQIEAIGSAGDVALGISTSGKSKNVINGLSTARDLGLKTIALSGKDTTYLSKVCDKVISIPANNTSRIQEMHIFIGQMICNAIESNLGLSKLVEEEK